MCSVLEFSSESDKLRTLFSESNHFDSVLFIFDGGRRYKVSSSSLGIHSPQDLLLPLGLGLFRSSPFWSYYLYPQGCNFHKGIDGLCGEVIRHTGSCVSEQSCHIFPDRSRSRLHILYRCDDEYRLECRRLNRGSFLLKKEERKKDFLQISWNRLNDHREDDSPTRQDRRIRAHRGVVRVHALGSGIEIGRASCRERV